MTPSPEALPPLELLAGVALPLLTPVLLAIARCLGLAWTAPLLSSSCLPVRVRVAVAVCLGVVLGTALPLPGTVAGAALAWAAAGELVLGAALGLGAKLVLVGLELSAALIDQPIGLTPAAAPGPLWGHDSAATAPWMVLIGALAFLAASPLGGDWLVIGALIDSLGLVPLGSVIAIDRPVQFVMNVMQAALMLGFQAAAPVVVTVGLLQGLWAILGRARGAALWQSTLTPARILLSVLVLAITASDVGVVVSERVGAVLHAAAPAMSAPDAPRQRESQP